MDLLFFNEYHVSIVDGLCVNLVISGCIYCDDIRRFIFTPCKLSL